MQFSIFKSRYLARLLLLEFKKLFLKSMDASEATENIRLIKIANVSFIRGLQMHETSFLVNLTRALAKRTVLDL